jgi:hypothetical protein
MKLKEVFKIGLMAPVTALAIWCGVDMVRDDTNAKVLETIKGTGRSTRGQHGEMESQSLTPNVPSQATALSPSPLPQAAAPTSPPIKPPSREPTASTEEEKAKEATQKARDAKIRRVERTNNLKLSVEAEQDFWEQHEYLESFISNLRTDNSSKEFKGVSFQRNISLKEIKDIVSKVLSLLGGLDPSDAEQRIKLGDLVASLRHYIASSMKNNNINKSLNPEWESLPEADRRYGKTDISKYIYIGDTPDTIWQELLNQTSGQDNLNNAAVSYYAQRAEKSFQELAKHPQEYWLSQKNCKRAQFKMARHFKGIRQFDDRGSVLEELRTKYSDHFYQYRMSNDHNISQMGTDFMNFIRNL